MKANSAKKLFLS